MSTTATGITVQAWIDGGASEPEVTVSLARSEHEGLYELIIERPGCGIASGILLDPDSLHQLLDWSVEQS